MPLNRPILDDRSYEQLRDELIRRIPVYTPEWTDHNVSDPGITFIELFSFLGENLLYRFNQIPEATKLEFLKLLQIPLQRAQPARALVALSTKELSGVKVAQGSESKAGRVVFETETEVRVLPLSAIAVAKAATEQPDDGEEAVFFAQAYQAAGLDSVGDAAPYQSEMVWEEAPGIPVDFDQTVDNILWVALLAEDKDKVGAVKSALAEHDDAPLLVNIGFVPEVRIDTVSDTTTAEFANRFRCPGENSVASTAAVQWQISTGLLEGEDEVPVYHSVSVEGDTTNGLSDEGVVRLRLPRAVDELGPFDLDDLDRVGTGDLPPALDAEYEARLICWLRAFRHDGGSFGKVLYVGANSTTVVQMRTARTEFLGLGDGQPNQTYTLINQQIVPGSVKLEVEEAGGWQSWSATEGLHSSSESDRHFLLDSEAGTIRFGNGINGYVPQIGQRIRVSGYRYGGGVAGNVAADAISKITTPRPVKIANPLAAYGGADAEALEKALDRIPGELRRRDRAVTRDDFKELALMTPGADIGRAECLPRYNPMLPDDEAAGAGIVSVIVWPKQDSLNPNAPMPDKNQLRRVCQWLDARRLVTTEHYVLAPQYRAIAVAVGLKVKPGFGIDAVRYWVELVIRQYLAPLPPYGPAGEGWPLGRRVHAPELEAAALQVDGVEYLEDLQVVSWDASGNLVNGSVVLLKNEVPELTAIAVEDGPITIEPGSLIAPAAAPRPPIPVPVLKEEC
ncbi:MAG: putative baseplate assembly protein [Gammaproteobacteria bacterium]|nr:putative baseplate assembly protein [Gammaproteobacteria bacterium]